MVVRSYLVEHGFFALCALMLYHIALIFPVVDVYRLHFCMTFGCSITRILVIDMFRAEAKGTVIPGGSFRVDGDESVAVFALERFIMHYEGHGLGRSFIIKMAGKFSEEVYEFCFIERMFLHETFQ